MINESREHPEKQDDPRNSTLFGIKIDSSDESENASDSIRVKCEFDSNVINKSDLQYEKHLGPRISTLFGIKIDSSYEYENASDSIRVKCEFLGSKCFSRCGLLSSITFQSNPHLTRIESEVFYGSSLEFN
jgi:hypothetical protein